MCLCKFRLVRIEKIIQDLWRIDTHIYPKHSFFVSLHAFSCIQNRSVVKMRPSISTTYLNGPFNGIARDPHRRMSPSHSSAVSCRICPRSSDHKSQYKYKNNAFIIRLPLTVYETITWLKRSLRPLGPNCGSSVWGGKCEGDGNIINVVSSIHTSDPRILMPTQQ